MAKLSIQDIAEIKALRKQGQSLHAIAKQFNVSVSAIQYHTRDILCFSKSSTASHLIERSGLLKAETPDEILRAHRHLKVLLDQIHNQAHAV